MPLIFRALKPRQSICAVAMLATAIFGVALGARAMAAEPTASPAPVAKATTAAPTPATTAPVAAATLQPGIPVLPPPPGVLPTTNASALATPPALQSPPPPPKPIATPVPLLLAPDTSSVPLGGSSLERATGVYGVLSATVANASIATVNINQDDRTLAIYGHTIGQTTITVSDQRGMTRTLPVTVAPYAGSLAPSASVRITGDPASPIFVAEIAADAAMAAAHPLPGAVVSVDPAGMTTHPIESDEIAQISVPMTISGQGLFTVRGVTTVQLENLAQPPVHPTSLIVSDFPEKLLESGLLFTSVLQPSEPTRMMFYHYNPKGQPNRHIVLRAENHGDRPALVQLIDGHGGPSGNEMMVGHQAARRFLLRSQQNQGTLIGIPAKSTTTLVDAALPAGDIVNDMMQLREIDGDPLNLTLTAEDRGTPALNTTGAQLLTAHEHHARGVYSIPQFFYETTYTVGSEPVSIPIGQLPLPNLRKGEALIGDYGVELTIDAVISNPTSEAVPIAIYANPRGGSATGTFLIDRAIVQAHKLKSYSNYKLRQYLVPAHGLVNVQVITIPEGGSSYPVNIIIAPDDGSVAPGAPGSPIYSAE